MNALKRSASTVTESTATYDVFISYSHADLDWVRDTLQPRLESWGLCVGVDHQNFLPGRRLAGTIREFIRASRHVIFVCTKAFADSEWCREELETVRAGDPAGLRAKAIPVVLEEGSVPDLLSDVIWCNLTANPYDKQEWQKLCAAMGGNWQDSYLEVKEVIQNAVETEFKAYRSLPAH